jgi:uncharacterized protein (DUF1330 family)
MDDQNAGPKRDVADLVSRPPTQSDLVALCRELNQRGAKYVVVGGLAIIAAGLARITTNVDYLVAVDSANEAKVIPRSPRYLTTPSANSNRASYSNTMSSA